MFAYTTTARERGVLTIPVHLRRRAGIGVNTECTFVELEPDLWLVGPKSRHPEKAAPAVAAALHSGESSPFPKLMRRVLAEEASSGERTLRRYRPIHVPELTDEQMMALGTPTLAAPRRRRGRG